MPTTTIPSAAEAPPIRTGTGAADDAALLLLVWLSPAFPVGSFAYSHGLEWAHEAGDLKDAADLRDWIADLADHGSLCSDLIVANAAHFACSTGDNAALREVAELAVALAPSKERHLETVQQGSAFLRAVRDAWPCASVETLRQAWDGEVAYPVALAVAAAGHGIQAPVLLESFGLAFVSNLVSAAIRLGVVGQTDGQRVIAASLPAVRAAARFAHAATLSDLGACALRSDLASLRHETQYTRLFRS